MQTDLPPDRRAELDALLAEIEAQRDALKRSRAQARWTLLRSALTLPLTIPMLMAAIGLVLVAGLVQLLGKGAEALGNGLNRAARAISGLDRTQA